MLINHRLEFVSGAFDTETGELVCVKFPKYGCVELCFKAGMNIPFARIVLHSRDLAIDADAVLEDAYRLGQEIAKRWNAGAHAVTADQEKPVSDRLIALILENTKGISKEQINPEAHFVELGLDSLDAIELVMSIEEEFGITFDDDEAAAIVTVAQAEQAITSKLNQKTNV